MKTGYLSFRISGMDGVSLEAHRWEEVLRRMGHEVVFIAGELDCPGILIPSIHFASPEVKFLHDEVVYNKKPFSAYKQTIGEHTVYIKKLIAKAISDAKLDALIVSNVFSLPIHFTLAPALNSVITELKLPVISRNHDFWWERERYIRKDCENYFKCYFPPNNNLIQHLTINSIAQKEFKQRTGLDSQIFADSFDYKNVKKHDRISLAFKRDFGIAEDAVVFLQPTRIVPRKKIELAIELLYRLKNPKAVLVVAGYSGDENSGYLTLLKEMLGKLKVKTYFIGDRISEERRAENGKQVYTLWDCFLNCDFVTYPSEFEGFGNQFIEAIGYRKPIFMNKYDVYKADLEPLGFKTVSIEDLKITDKAVEQVKFLLENPAEVSKMVDFNFKIASENFSYEVLEEKLKVMLSEPALSSFNSNMVPREGFEPPKAYAS